MTDPRDTQSGGPTARTTVDTAPGVASAAERESVHYETDPDQLVRVVHQVRPQALPPATATDDALGGPRTESVTDVWIAPETASVHEARPKGG